MIESLRHIGLVPVVVIDDPYRAVPLADALTDGGVPCIEITLRTDSALECIRRIARDRPDVLIGAGTVLTPAQTEAAVDAGARFVVTPGFDETVVDRCIELGVAVYPGVCTPTEVQAALRKGLHVLKFFPAEPMGGLPYLNAIASPFPGVEFIPTGGVSRATLESYLASPRVVAVGGSWLAPASRIAAAEFDHIRREARAAMDDIRTFRERPS